MDLFDKVNAVNDKKSFLEFIKALEKDFIDNKDSLLFVT